MKITLDTETYGYFIDQLSMSFDWSIHDMHSSRFWADMHGWWL